MNIWRSWRAATLVVPRLCGRSCSEVSLEGAVQVVSLLVVQQISGARASCASRKSSTHERTGRTAMLDDCRQRRVPLMVKVFKNSKVARAGEVRAAVSVEREPPRRASSRRIHRLWSASEIRKLTQPFARHRCGNWFRSDPSCPLAGEASAHEAEQGSRTPIACCSNGDHGPVGTATAAVGWLRHGCMMSAGSERPSTPGAVAEGALVLGSDAIIEIRSAVFEMCRGSFTWARCSLPTCLDL